MKTLRPIEGRTPNEIETLFKDFINLEVNLRNARPATIDGYVSAMQLFLRVVKEADLRNIQQLETWEGFFIHLNQRERLVGKEMVHTGIKNSTIRTYASKLNSFMKWLQARGHIQVNAIHKINLPEVDYVDRRWLIESDLRKLMEACRYKTGWANDFVRMRNFTILRVLLFTGIRRGELMGLKVSDFNLDTATLLIRAETSKSKRPRELPISRELMVDLRDYLTIRRNHPIAYTTPAMFPSSTQDRALTLSGLKRIVEKLANESGVRFHIHKMRHTYATELNRHGIAPNHLQQLLGHKSPAMTMAYGRNVSVDTLRTSVEKIGSDGFSR